MARRKRRRSNTYGNMMAGGFALMAGGVLFGTHTGRILLAVGVFGGGGTYATVAIARKVQRSKIARKEALQRNEDMRRAIIRQQEAAVQRQEAECLRAIRLQNVSAYMAMDATEFEHALAFLCQRDGCHSAKVVGGAGDLGADVIAVTPLGQRLVIQAKRYVPGNLVTGPNLQKFGGTCFAVHHADVAVVITTSGFTRQAQQYAAHMGIKLFGREELGAWVSRTGPPPWAGRGA